MPTVKPLLFLLALLLLVYPVHAEEIVNGDFENNTDENDAVIDEWTTYITGSGGSYNILQTDGAGVDSSVGCRFFASGSSGNYRNLMIYQPVSISDNESTLHLSRKVTSRSGNQLLRIVVYNGSTSFTTTLSTTDADWVEMEYPLAQGDYNVQITFTFSAAGSAYYYAYIDNVYIDSLAVTESSSYGSVTTPDDDNLCQIGDYVLFNISLTHVENTYFDNHDYYLLNCDGTKEGVPEFLYDCYDYPFFSYTPNETGTYTVYFYEHYNYTDSDNVLQDVTNLLDDETITVYEDAPEDSDSGISDTSDPGDSSGDLTNDNSLIWSENTEFHTNESIVFYWSVDDIDLSNYDYWYYSSDESGYNSVTHALGTFNRTYMINGSYEVGLVRVTDGSSVTEGATVLDTFTFDVDFDTDGDDPDDPGDDDNSTDPDDPIDDGDDTGNNTDDGDIPSYDNSSGSTYRSGIDGIGDSVFVPIEGGFSYLVSPVNDLNDSISSAIVYFENSSAEMETYNPVIIAVMGPVVNSIPAKVQALITYNLGWLLIIMLFRGK